MGRNTQEMIDQVVTYRNLPPIKKGWRCIVDGREGKVWGGNSSANFNILFNDDRFPLNCHPSWKMEIFMNWRPIETAPTSDEPVLFFIKHSFSSGGYILLGRRSDVDGAFIGDETGEDCGNPSYWMPLPAKPAETTEHKISQGMHDELRDKYDSLLAAAKNTLMENLNLCDGDICTLYKLKSAVLNADPAFKLFDNTEST